MEIKNTAPLIIGEGLNKVNLSRRFLGNLFPTNQYEQNELKAYIKGHSSFRYGRDEYQNPFYWKTRQEYFYEKP